MAEPGACQTGKLRGRNQAAGRETFTENRRKSRRSSSLGYTAWWICAIIVALAAIEPLTHVWIAYCPPPDTVPTGMHIGDSGHHLLCMRAFETGFYSPFAKDAPPYGTHSFRFFAPPLFLLYALLGLVQHALGIDAFLFLGLANGIGGALYLTAAYAFLRQATPSHARRAFVLFALGGGLGGILFLVTRALGLYSAPAFEEYFRRYAHYELIEGPHLSPVLLMPRLYYTLPMAALLAGLAAFLRAERDRDTRRVPLAMGLLFAGALINVRLGPVAWGIAVLYLACRTDRPAGERLRWAAALAVPVALGAALASYLIGLSPAYAANLLATVKESMWFSPFVSAVFFYFLLVPGEVRRGLRQLPRWLAVIGGAAAGYLVAFTVLYLGYQAYYGNVWRCLDVTVAIRMSDWALLGTLPGAAWMLRRRGPAKAPDTQEPTGWVTLWLLLFLGLALSAFGQGAFMRLNPQRLMVWLGLPIAVLAAQGLAHLETGHRTVARALMTIIIGCGICSAAVASLWFQGPLEREPAQGPFAYLHYEVMTPADARLLDRVETGRVLTPPWSPISFGEIVALRPGLSVVAGPGAMNIAAEPYPPLQTRVARFFDPQASDEERRALVVDWHVDYVYCPDTCPVQQAVVDQFRVAPWLRLLAEEGRASLFEVVRQVALGNPCALANPFHSPATPRIPPP